MLPLISEKPIQVVDKKTEKPCGLLPLQIRVMAEQNPF